MTIYCKLKYINLVFIYFYCIINMGGIMNNYQEEKSLDEGYNYQGEKFLDKVYKDLHLSEIVIHTANKSDDKYQKIEKYMKRLEDVTKRVSEHDKINLIKMYYYKKYVIKEQNVPESYFRKQEKIALDRGYGHVKYDEETKKQEIEHIINEQKASLDMWLDYFFSKDTDMYPTWFKYYVFQGMLKLGYFDKEKNSYTKRTESTVKPFIELNREALSLIYSELIKFLNKESIDDEKLNALINNGSFSKLYSYAILKLDSVKDDGFKSDDGIWKKYNQGSNPEILFNDINGKGTGWCTAGGIDTARAHINGGDFHVYYTKDREGNYTKPRIAIRMNGNQIAEIRGISENQNIESNMEKVVDKKLEEFPDRDKYKKKVKDMEMLTYIYTKHQNKGELTKVDLRFLYEIDDEITGFGYGRDPRIEELLYGRNVRKDLALVFDCKEENISLTKKEALSGNIIYHYGDLSLSGLTSAEDLKLPDKIGGNLDLSGLTSAEGLKLPVEIGESLDLGYLTSAEDLKLPDKIGGDLDLSGLTSAEGLKLPNGIGGDLSLSGLTSAEDLKIPTEIGGYLDLRGLISAEGLKLPDKVGGYLSLSGLTSAEDLKLPTEIGGGLLLDSLASAKDLKLPDKIGGNLDLSGLTSAEGLKLPDKVGGYLSLSGLKSAKGLELPTEIEGSLYLNSLTSAEGLKLPTEIGGGLLLDSLVSAKDLKLPDKIGGNLDLSGLTSAEGLKLPNGIGGDLSLSGLTSAKGLELPTEIGGYLDLRGLISAEGLKLPDKVGGYLDLSGLTSAEGLKLPNEIEDSLFLSGLTSAEGLKLPDKIGGHLSLSGLTSAEGLKLPVEIGKSLELSGLTSAEGLKLPDKIGGYLDLNGLTSAKDLELPTKIGGLIRLTSLKSIDGLDLSSRFISKMMFSDEIEQQLTNGKTRSA